MAEPLRQVLREHRFERELRALIPDPGEADEFIESAELVLARDVEAGCQSEPHSLVWYMPMAPVGDTQLWLFYTFDEKTVRLLSVGRFDA